MFKVWSPYGFSWNEPPIQLAKMHSRGMDADWAKSASIEPEFMETFRSFVPDKGHVLVHVAPVADHEKYSCNVNGDGFPKSANVSRHSTFLSGHAFREHDNKNPKKAFGKPLASGYNEKLGRIELLVDVDSKLNPTLVEKLASGDPVDWSMSCAHLPDTPVLTDKGYRSIKDVVPGTWVLTHNRRWRKVYAASCREYTGDLITFKAKGIPIPLQFTADHPFMAFRRKDVPVAVGYEKQSAVVSDITDRSLTARWYRFRKNNGPSDVLGMMDWTNVGDLETGDKGMVITHSRPCTHPVIESEDLGWLLGCYTAEGCIGKDTSTNKHMVRFDVHKDDWAVERLPEICRGLFDKEPGIRVHPVSDEARTIEIWLPDVAPVIAETVGRRGVDKTVPPEISSATRSVQLAYLGGWLDGDGWYDVKGAHWSTAHRSLALELRDMLLMMGFAPSIYHIVHQNGYKKGGHEYTVNIPPADVQEIAPYSKKLRDAADQWEGAESQRGKSALQPTDDGRAVCTFEIIGREHVENALVYNISVEDDESYAVAGIVTHNCRVAFDECNVCGNLATSPRGPTDQAVDVPSPGYCLVPGTPVITDRGLRSIEAIRPNDRVLSHTGTFRAVDKAFFREYDGELVSLSVVGTNVPAMQMTAEHPVAVVTTAILKGGVAAWRKRKKSSRRDELVVKFVDAGDLTEDDYVYLPFPTNVESFPADVRDLSALFAFFGLYAAEGSVARHKDVPRAVRFSVHAKELKPLEKAVHEWLNRMGVTAHVSANLTNTEYHGRSAEWGEIYVGSPKLATLCAEHIGTGSRIKSLSSAVLLADKTAQRELLVQWINGDGSVDKDGAVRGTTSSYDLAYQMRILCGRCEIPSTIIEYERDANFGHQIIYYVRISRRSSYDLGFTDKPVKNPNEKVFLWNNGIVSKIRKLSKQRYKGVVHNMSVEIDDSYTTPHCATHNCKHAKYNLGAIMDNGHRVAVLNPHPDFFDISEVGSPAEVLARSMGFRKAANKGWQVEGGMRGVDIAEKVGLEVPMYLKASLPVRMRDKLAIAAKVAELEKDMPAQLQTLSGLSAALPSDDGDAGEAGRELLASPAEQRPQALKSLRDNGVILGIRDFLNIGGESDTSAMKAAAVWLPHMFSYLDQYGLLTDVAADGSFDDYDVPTDKRASQLAARMFMGMSLQDVPVRQRLLSVEKPASVKIARRMYLRAPDHVERLLRKYAAFQLSELSAIGQESAPKTQIALTAIQRNVN